MPTFPRARHAFLIAITCLSVVACLPAHPGDPTDAWLRATRTCESHGDYSAVSSSGKYRGAYQFDRTTWNGEARTHLVLAVGMDPAGAPTWLQDDMARALYRDHGAGRWPVCGRH